ncbi:MAG: TVP38/TMEM64 family protein [Clostridia bacterium]|nr:TVP38/TMEM64 family protein [Clostridia bacterium]
MKVVLSVKYILSVIAVILISVLTVCFSVLYVNTFTNGFFYNNKSLILSIIVITVAVITVISLSFLCAHNKTIYKLSVITLSLISFALLVLYFLKTSGFLDKIDSIEDLRNYVASFGYNAHVIFTIINVLQVVILPIPGFISIGTGVALFGPLIAGTLSFIGITIGSIIAFFIGRILGYKVVKWIVGEETLKTWLNKVKNKDKIVLTFMFLFPFFPDDVLCFVAGLSTMSAGYFLVTIIICRLTSAFLSAFSLNGNLIPYTTWWGILIWAVVILSVVILTVYLYKNGDKLIKQAKSYIKKRRKSFENDTSR